ncbi:hypothetical protein FYK55_13235 [Roseiconus nitratireducens]|uniref:Uncharacterized protein n=1 Tax=Roseiconus nitratireducens TaxID=2605748 RepID=A0A5M6D6R7_9BACT|nr:hypothetical protein [Roseiconus nitratireducens]KAA5543234.1 hypothetical protein FYK55_13235 [Roseiconus nitratireducens]
MNIRLIHTVLRHRAATVLALAATAAMNLGGTVTSAQSLADSQLIDAEVANAAAFGPGPAASYSAGTAFGLSPGTRVIQASQVRTAADVTPGRSSVAAQRPSGPLAPGTIAQAVGVSDANERGAIAQVGFGCRSCSRSSCNGGCYSGGYSGGYAGGYGASMSGASYGSACGVPCDPYCYVTVEGLYMNRGGDDGFSYTRNVVMDDFDFEFAPRITIGRVPDCVNGFEFTWIGQLDWDRSVSVVDPGEGIQSVLVAAGDLDPSLVAPFQNSTYQAQTYSSEYSSFELNKTLMGWDVVKLLIGGRYINFDEDYRLTGWGNPGTGLITSMTENDLIGAQVGVDMLYPVARHLYTDLRGRAGAYLNVAESDVRLYNQAELAIRNQDDDVELAGVFEGGAGLRLQCGEMLSVRVGGEIWYIAGLATASDQLTPRVTENFGRNVDIDDDIFFVGVTASAELRF